MAWNLPRGEAFLPNVSEARLKKLSAEEKDKAVSKRLLAAYHRKRGLSIDEIADALLLHRRSIQDILHRFVERGIDAAHALPKSGRKKRLTDEQLKKLKQKLLKTPRASGFDTDFWNSKMVAELVHREYGVTFVARHVTRLLLKLGFSYKKPRHANPRCAADAEVRKFKKKPIEKSWQLNEKAGRFSQRMKRLFA